MKCPGQDRSYWTGDAVHEVPCPECGAAVEIFRDESAGRCARCGHKFLDPGANFGCAQWCSLAKECLGFARSGSRSQVAPEGALAARLIQRVEQSFKNDPARIAHVLRVFQFAKELVREEGGDPRVVLCASLLLATGTHEAVCTEEASGAPSSQTGATSADEVLQQMGLDEVALREFGRSLVAITGTKTLMPSSLRIVCDADRLAKLAVEHFTGSPDELENMIHTSLRTETGKRKARGLIQVSPTVA